MFTPVSLVVGFTIFVSSVYSLPGGYPPYHQNGQPNVALFNLPSTITPPTGETLNSVFIGYGTQNYSCNPATSTYYTNGTAEAKLYDVTSLYTGSTPPAVYPPLASLQPAVDHFYVPNPNAPATVIPRFQLCNPGQYFEGTKNNTVANAVPSYSVAAVLLQKVQGTLADWVVRTNVVGGVVPAALNTCSAGENIAIPYKANYLFFSK